MGKKLVGALLAAVVAFMWGWISWMALPFHNQSLNKFTNESVASIALKTNAPKHGIYVLPMGNHMDKNLSKEQQKVAFKAHAKAMERGPFAFVSIIPDGKSFQMEKSMGIAFAKDFLVALLIIWLLGHTKGLGFFKKVAFVKIAALSGAIVSILPNYIWWGFPLDFTILALLDVGIAWGLAGCVIAKFTD